VQYDILRLRPSVATYQADELSKHCSGYLGIHGVGVEETIVVDV